MALLEFYDVTVGEVARRVREGELSARSVAEVALSAVERAQRPR